MPSAPPEHAAPSPGSGPWAGAAGGALGGALASLAAASDALAALVAHVGQGTVGVNLEGRADGASGTIWRPGVVVTVAHPLGRSRRQIRVTLADGHTLAAELVGIDHATDLAVLRLPADALARVTPVAQGSADHLVAGHFVIALGRSVRGDAAASCGIVHRTGAAWQTWTGGRIDRLIRLDGGLFDGLSGGPVCDAQGHVVGLANGALARGGGVVVPTATLNRVVDAVLANGRVVRPYLGIVAQPVSNNAVIGLLVTGLDERGPAAGAGLMVGDIVQRLAGVQITDLAALRDALAVHGSGVEVRLGVSRAGQAMDVNLIAGEAPAAQSRGCR